MKHRHVQRIGVLFLLLALLLAGGVRAEEPQQAELTAASAPNREFPQQQDQAAVPMATWTIDIVDDITLATSVGEHASLALDSNDIPHISYYDVTTSDLKYARYVGAGGNCGPGGNTWRCDTIDGVPMNVAYYTSLALDGNDIPHISYYDLVWLNLKYATYVGVGGNCGPGGNTWQCDTIDSDLLTGWHTSIATDSANQPHISYYDANAATRDLKYAHYVGAGGNCGPLPPGDTWQCDVVHGTDDAGRYTSLVLDAADLPRISYYENTNDDLYYAAYDGSTWTRELVDDGGGADVGKYSSLELDATGQPHISYYDDGSDDLKYARYVGALGNCGSGAWQCDAVDIFQDVGRYTSLELDSFDHPHISYCRYGVFACEDLYYAYFDGTSWLTETVEPIGFPLLGAYSSLALARDNHPRIAYLQETPSYHLKYAYDATCEPVRAVTITGPIDLVVGQVGAYTAGDPPFTSTLPLSITWDNGTVGPNANYSWALPGIYTIIATITNPCSVLTGTLVVSVCQPVEGAAIGGPAFLLTGQNGVYTASYTPITASLPITFSWDNGTVGPSANYSWALPGFYTITVTATNACSQTQASFVVEVCQPITDVVIVGPAFLQVGQNGLYNATYSPPTASMPVTRLWDNGTIGANASYSWAQPGTYTITVTATNACSQIQDNFVVEVCQPVQGASIGGPAFLLTGQNGVYNASYTPITASLPITFSWDNGTIGPTANYSWALPGFYTISVTATNACGQVQASFVVEVCQPITDVVIVGPAFLQVGQNGLYNASYSPPTASMPVTRLWDNGTIGANASYSWALPGFYTISVTATNACGQVQDSFVVEVCQPITDVVILGPAFLQVGQIGGYSTSYSPTNASLPITFGWDNGTVGTNANYSWALPGFYTVSVTATNACGQVQASFVVEVCQSITDVVIVGPAFLQVGQIGGYSTSYSPTNASLPITFSWDNGTIGANASYSWALPGFYTISVTATNACGQVQDSFIVEVCQPVQGASISGPGSLHVGENGIYNTSHTPLTATAPITYTWDNGTIGPSANYSWALPGFYTITLTATNPCGQVQQSLTVQINLYWFYMPLMAKPYVFYPWLRYPGHHP